MNVPDAIVYVVDDDASVRNSLRNLLQSSGLIVETFPEAQSFLNAERSNLPGCLVLDVALPGLTGLDLQQRLTATGRSLPIVFITGNGDIPMSVKAMKAGAFTFLAKPFLPGELLVAIRDAIEIDRVARVERGQVDELDRRYQTLTPRERDVLSGVVAGLLNKQIAADLGSKEATVKEQRAQVMRKMLATSVADLVRMTEKLSKR